MGNGQPEWKLAQHPSLKCGAKNDFNTAMSEWFANGELQARPKTQPMLDLTIDGGDVPKKHRPQTELARELRAGWGAACARAGAAPGVRARVPLGLGRAKYVLSLPHHPEWARAVAESLDARARTNASQGKTWKGWRTEF